MTIMELAKQSMEHPPNYGYFGDKPKYHIENGEGWGDTPFDTHRDADSITRSNWAILTEDLQERFPEDFEIEGGGHWAVGWYERIIMRVYKNGEINVAPLNAVLEYVHKLDSYPVLDEEKMMEEDEKDGGRCGYCGESGHHDCKACDGGIEAFAESEDSKDKFRMDECYNCGNYRFDHAGYIDD